MLNTLFNRVPLPASDVAKAMTDKLTAGFNTMSSVEKVIIGFRDPDLHTSSDRRFEQCKVNLFDSRCTYLKRKPETVIASGRNMQSFKKSKSSD
jgi:hypothetical protein